MQDTLVRIPLVKVISGDSRSDFQQRFNMFLADVKPTIISIHFSTATAAAPNYSVIYYSVLIIYER